MFIYVVEKYSSCSQSATDVGRSQTDMLKTESLCERQHFDSHNITVTQQPFNSKDAVDGNRVACLSAEYEKMLTDITEVINQDSSENCEITSHSAPLLPGCDLQATVSNAHVTTEFVSSYAEVTECCISNAPVYSAVEFPVAMCSDINSENTLPRARLQSSVNRLSAAFTAQQKKSS